MKCLKVQKLTNSKRTSGFLPVKIGFYRSELFERKKPLHKFAKLTYRKSIFSVTVLFFQKQTTRFPKLLHIKNSVAKFYVEIVKNFKKKNFEFRLKRSPAMYLAEEERKHPGSGSVIEPLPLTKLRQADTLSKLPGNIFAHPSVEASFLFSGMRRA